MGDFPPNVRPIAALRARVLAAQGRWGEALDWVRERGLSVGDNLSYVREFEHITLARVLLARFATNGDQNGLNAVAQLLGRLLSAAAAGGRAGTVIEILILQALVRYHSGDIPGALEPLEESLNLAEPEGYVRVFVNEGPPMAFLLTAVLKTQAGWAYVRRLLTAGTKSRRQRRRNNHFGGGQGPCSRRHRSFGVTVNLDVLLLLTTDLCTDRASHINLSSSHAHNNCVCFLARARVQDGVDPLDRTQCSLPLMVGPVAHDLT